MFSHVFNSVAEFGRAHRFYAPLMAELGLRQLLAKDHATVDGRWQ